MIRSTGKLAVRALVILIAWSVWMSEEFAEVDLAQTALAGQFDRPAADPHQSRSVVIAKHGIVATSHPLAAEAGLDVLKKGGNAADAAITASAMLGLVEPMSCGIGGDVFVIYWDNKTQTLYGLNGSGRSPYSISRKTFRDKGLDEIPINGPLAWSVPGCVDGWDMLRKRFGTLEFHELLAQPIQTARDGFPVSEIIGRSWAASQSALANWPDSARTYLPGGKAPGVGQVFTNPDLAWSYSQIAEHGRDAFYKGQIAKRIVDFSGDRRTPAEDGEVDGPRRPDPLDDSHILRPRRRWLPHVHRVQVPARRRGRQLHGPRRSPSRRIRPLQDLARTRSDGPLLHRTASTRCR